jgi:hypothetical protein
LISRTKLTFEYGAAGGYMISMVIPTVVDVCLILLKRSWSIIPIAKFFGPRVLVSLLEVDLKELNGFDAVLLIKRKLICVGEP